MAANYYFFLFILWISFLQIPSMAFSEVNHKKNYELTVKDQRIFLKAENVPLKAILDELSAKLNIKIRHIGPIDINIAGHIHNAGIEDFLRQIAISYAIKSNKGSQDGKIVYLVPKSNIILQNQPKQIPQVKITAMQNFIAAAPDAAVRAATRGLQHYIDAAIQDNPILYGFIDDKEIKSASLDDPFMIYTIDPKKIMDADGSVSMSTLVESTDHWLFPVMAADGSYRSLLGVAVMNGTWKAVTFGGTELAKQLEDFADQRGALQSNQTKFVRVYKANSDMIIISQQGKEAVCPLLSATQSLNLNGRHKGLTLYSSQYILEALRSFMRNK